MVLEFAYCFDENNGWQAAVSINSLLNTLLVDDNDSVQIDCVYVGKKNEQQINYITDLVNSYDFAKISFFDFDRSDVENGYELRGISVATYVRLFLPDILEKSKIVLYCDCDIIFIKSCSDVFNLCMDDCAVRGAFTELNTHQGFKIFEKELYYEAIKPVKGKYINAGIMVLNLDFIRKYGLHNDWKSCIGFRYIYQDQDIINIKTYGFIKELPMRYNTCITSLKCLNQMVEEQIISEEELVIIKNNPSIIHYTGDKPWNRLSVTYSELWWNYVLNDTTLLNVFKDKLLSNIADTKGELEKKNTRLKWIKKLDNLDVSIIKDYSVSIYAWGDLGKKLYRELNLKGISVKYVIDKRKSFMDGESEIGLYSLDDCLPEVEFVIIAMDYDEFAIKEILNARGFKTLFLKDITI